MQLLYANSVIAKEMVDGGTDAIQGFYPTGRQVVQKVPYLRAAYATNISRSNREVTLTGTIIPAPGASLEATMLARETFYGSLPDTGDLVKTINGNSVTYPAASLEMVEVLQDLNGIAYGFRLTFQAGKPGAFVPAADAPITGPSGANLTTPGGVPLTEPS